MRALIAFAAVAMLAGLIPAADAAPDFNTYFVDETLRVDYFHVGHAAEELVTLDRVYRQGIW
ncbi:MAG TPA: peptidase M64 N-terminal domain-containing protein, partial [Acidobacteriota bacterium]|nr:peptidase M64 N-terminal domain-containing protein [Acidobacteriota bacterium]